MIKTTENTLSHFSKVLDLDLRLFLDLTTDFLENESVNVEKYYSGEVTSPNIETFTKLSFFISQLKQIISKSHIVRNQFTTTKYWQIFELFEDLLIKLQTLENIGFYLNSTITKGNFNTSISVDLKMKRSITLERLEREQLSSLDPENDWVNLALSNRMQEESYTPKGGYLIKANLALNRLTASTLESILGSLEGENMLGKDINKKFTFIDDDLEVLSPQNTMNQSANIYLALEKGQNPEFPEDGKKKIAGENLSSIAYPVIVRDLINIFSKDDSFSELTLTNVRYDQGSLFLDVNIGTVYGDNFNKIVQI